MNRQGKAYKLFSGRFLFPLLLIVIYLTLISFLSQKCVNNIRAAIDHCFVYTTEHEQNLHDKIPLYRGPFANTPTLR
jgi:hypothetical protein